jgi:hypothetical protein
MSNRCISPRIGLYLIHAKSSAARVAAPLWLVPDEPSYYGRTGLFIDAERTKVESNVVPITGFTL